MCADRQDRSTGPYAALLQQRGCRVVNAALFTHRVLMTDLPEPALSSGFLTIVPSPRAAQALAQQPWFPALRPSIRAIAPGAETANSLRKLGIRPVWSATGGFRHEPLPSELQTMPKLYLGNAALERSELGLDLDPARDVFLPVYRRQLSTRCPWSGPTARQITQSAALTVLALSPSQRHGFESLLDKLGSKRPRDLRLISLSRRTRTRFSANFWTEMAFPEPSNRESLLELLKCLAF